MRLKSKIPSITNLATTAGLNAKINEVKNEIPSIANLATNTGLTAVENKIPNVSNSVKKGKYNTKMYEIEKKITDHDHDKYISTPYFNYLTSETFAARLAQANLSGKNNITVLVKQTDFDEKLIDLNKNVTSNKNELNEVSKKKLKQYQ